MSGDVRPASITRADLFDVGWEGPIHEEDEMNEMAMQFMEFRDIYYTQGFAKRMFPHFAEKVDLENI